MWRSWPLVWLLANSVYEEERAKRLAAEAEVSQQALVIAEQAPKVVVYDEHVADSGLTKVHLYAGTLDGPVQYPTDRTEQA